MANKILDVFLVYQFVKRIITPFEKWPAFKLGIIDKDGKVLKKRKTLKDQEEKNAWGYFDIMTANMKKVLAKIPGGGSTVGTMAAAALLLREQNNLKELDEDAMELRLNQLLEGLKDPKDNPCWDGYKPVGTKKKNGKTVPNCVPEEVAVNNAGGGQVAGIGVGDKGEPGVTLAMLKRYKKKNKA